MYHGDISLPAADPYFTACQICFWAVSEGATRRKVDCCFVVGVGFNFDEPPSKDHLWWIAVCRIDQGGWPSVRPRP